MNYDVRMVITYFGKSYFKVTLGDLTIAINPPAKDAPGFPKPPRFGADIVLVTTHRPEYAGVETVAMGDKVPFVIDGPGSYESKGLFFTGVDSRVLIDGQEYINTIYGFELDAIKIAFMGIITDSTPLSLEAKELLSNADMVFIPIGGAPVFDAATAYKVATSFDPNVIIPYEYDQASLSHFLKEGGQEKNETLDKATVKRRDLDGKEAQIIVLAPQA